MGWRAIGASCSAAGGAAGADAGTSAAGVAACDSERSVRGMAMDGGPVEVKRIVNKFFNVRCPSVRAAPGPRHAVPCRVAAQATRLRPACLAR